MELYANKTLPDQTGDSTHMNKTANYPGKSLLQNKSTKTYYLYSICFSLWETKQFHQYVMSSMGTRPQYPNVINRMGNNFHVSLQRVP